VRVGIANHVQKGGAVRPGNNRGVIDEPPPDTMLPQVGLHEQRVQFRTVVGTRQGFRDVRKELDVLPGAPPPELVVRCEEPI